MTIETIITTLVAQAEKLEGWKVQKLIDELNRRIANNLPIPAAGQMISVEDAQKVIDALKPYSK